MVETISTTALDVFNIATGIDTPLCPFDDKYTKESILKPWKANSGKVYTDWIIMDTGEVGTYARESSNENGTAYIERIYDAAGTCVRPDSCCLNEFCFQSAKSPCNSGADCYNACSDLKSAIKESYNALLFAYDTEQRMTSDLGVRCPSEVNYNTCPTKEFQKRGNNETLVSLVELYGENITGTADNLVNIATTSVGETMDEVQDFLCNMNISFVANRYQQVRDNVCGVMFGGFAQVNWSLWILALCLEIIAVLSNILSTRLRGVSRSEAALQYDNYAGTKGFTRAQLYG